MSTFQRHRRKREYWGLGQFRHCCSFQLDSSPYVFFTVSLVINQGLKVHEDINDLETRDKGWLSNYTQMEKAMLLKPLRPKKCQVRMRAQNSSQSAEALLTVCERLEISVTLSGNVKVPVIISYCDTGNIWNACAYACQFQAVTCFTRNKGNK